MPQQRIPQKLRELANSIESLEGLTGEPWSFPHPDTERLLEKRRVPREQFSHSVPVDLDLRGRLNRFCLDNGNPGAGNVVAAIMDAALRAHGYPPPSLNADHKDSETNED